MNVIAITCYSQPELLHLYLEQLGKDYEELKKYKIRLYTEEGYDPYTNVVISHFEYNNKDIDIKLIVRPKVNCPLVGYHNILTSYILAAAESDEFVIIGEEDMLPTEDYLRFNRMCYEKFLSKYKRIFCVAHKRRPEVEKEGDPEILIGDYQCTSPSCVSVRSIKKYMEPYFGYMPPYFEDPVEFNRIYFPNSRIPPNEHTHHDGAIERIMEWHRLFSIKPDQTRSMHVGLKGIFCNGQAPKGTLQDKITQYRELIKDGDKLRNLSTLPDDMVVTDPKGPSWNDLRLDTDRVLAKASSWWYDEGNEFKEYIT